MALKPSGQYTDTKVREFYLDLWNPITIQDSIDDKIVKIDPKYHLRPDLMAYDLYGSTTMWWVFAIANPDTIIDPINDFVSGLKITQPSPTSVRSII